MKSWNQQLQRGLSTPTLLVVVALAVLLINGLFVVFPMYYENYQIQSILEKLKVDSSVDSKSKRAIWSALSKRLDINSVKSITRDMVKMSRTDGKTTVTIDYEARDTYFGNLFIGASFSESVVIER